MSDLTPSQLQRLYRILYLTRALEERFERLFKQGEIVGGLYRSLGQEATAVGCGWVLEDGDWLAPAIRDLGALLARGVDPRLMLRQFMARSNPYTGGRDNFNHFTDRGLGILGPVSPLGDQLCVLNGIALSFQKRDEAKVCMAFQGEGATRAGASHEGMNFAAALDLPMVVVLEHNRWSFSTPSHREGAVEGWTDVAAAYGLPVSRVDGNDLLEVLVAADGAVTRARRGGGPSLLVAETYRMLGHAQHDDQPYVDPDELEEWRERDPIRRFEDRLTRDHGFGPGALETVREEVDAELDEAVDEALATPRPDPEDARRRVYAAPMDPVPDAWTRSRPVGYSDLSLPVEPARPGDEHG